MSINHFGPWGKTSVSAAVAVVLFVFVVGLALAASLPPGGTFTDDDGNLHEANIEAIAAEGITQGCNPPVNDLYCPDWSVSRAQMATFLTRALDLPAATGSFTDTVGSVHEANIAALAAAGITVGCNPPTNDMFCPDKSVTRAQMATFLARALNLPAATGSFTDTAGSVHEANIAALAAAGITVGCNPPTNDMFCPDKSVTRAQMATFLTRALNLTPIVPPPPTSSTTSTTSGGTGTTLPPVGPAATFTGCGTGVTGVEFSLEQECVFSHIIQPTWASSLYRDYYFVWIGPDGQEVGHGCPATGDCTYIRFNYIGSSPLGWTVYFYIDAEDRDPGGYALEIWSAPTFSEPETLELRASFYLSDIPPTPTTTTTTSSTTSTTSSTTTSTTTSTTSTTQPPSTVYIDLFEDSGSWSGTAGSDSVSLYEDSGSWSGTIGSDSVSLYEDSGSWSGTIGSDSVSLSEDPGNWYGDWSGTIGSGSVSLYEDPDGLYGTGPRVAAAVIPILASSTP